MSTTSTLQRDGDVAVLADGRQVTIRRLQPSDADALVDAVQHEDPLDLHRRFMGTVPPASTLARYVARADSAHHVGLGAFTDAGRLVAVAQFDRVDDEASAEFAIEVAHDWQHDGLGSAMLARLAAIARGCGVRRFTAVYFADNLPIRRLLREVGVVSSGYDHGDGYATIDLGTTA